MARCSLQIAIAEPDYTYLTVESEQNMTILIILSKHGVILIAQVPFRKIFCHY